MDTSKVLGTHMISMAVDLAILHIDEVANKFVQDSNTMVSVNSQMSGLQTSVMIQTEKLL